MNDKEIDKLIREALRDERELPEGLSGQLESRIDQLAAGEARRVIARAKRRSLYWFGGIAASLLLGITLFFQVEGRGFYPAMTDTFDDPKEAALAARDVLTLLSTQLNKGLDQVSEAGKEIDRASDIVNKQFEALGVQPQSKN